MSLLAALLVACCPQVANEDTLLVSPSLPASASFGQRIAMDGDRMAVVDLGARLVHVFERDPSGAWAHVAAMASTSATAVDQFGNSLALDGDRIAVGARWRDAGAVDAGSVVIFDRQSSGAWVQVQELFSPDADAGDNFGFDVALSNERLVVGAAFDDALGANSGAAYVFEAIGGGTFLFSAKLVSSHGAGFDIAGWSVDIDGERCVVGAQYDDSFSIDAGAALVFELDPWIGWSHTASLYGATIGLGDRFGFDVAIEGPTVVVGAIGSDAGGPESGAAYVFGHQSGATWIEEARLVGPTTSAGDAFGISVAIDAGRVVVGASSDDSVNFEAGAAELFARRADSTWSHEVTLLRSDGKPQDQAGAEVAIGSAGIAVAAVSDDVMGVVNAGSVHVFDSGALFHGRPQVSISAPTPHNLHLRAGDAWSGALWFVAGSASGTSPGIPLGTSTVPLVYDAYTELTLALAAPLTAPIGTLDADGHGFCRFVLPSGTSPSFAGVVLHHAFVAVDPSTFAVLVSNAVRVELVP
jgi:hypothetical protein